MKLQNEDTYSEELKFTVYLIFIVAFVIICTVTIFPLLQLSLTKMQKGFLTYTIGILYIFAAIVIAILRSSIKQKNINRKNIKYIGKKQNANIVDIGKFKKGRGLGWGYYIVVFYDDKFTKIYSIENNRAYRILEMLLNPYPIRKNVTIPIDIYIYKNKVYADLDSVDLSKVEGYEEIIKIIE